MLLCAVLLYTSSLTMNTVTKPMQSDVSAANSAQSTELQSLKDDRKSARDRLQSLRQTEDGWNAANRWCGFGAILFGGVLGLGAFISQRNAATASLKQRPESEKVEAIDSRIKELGDQASQLASDTALNSAAQARKDAEEAKRGTAEATRMMEVEKLERVKLEALIVPRRLSLAQQEQIARECGSKLGKSAIIQSFTQDAESAVLANQIGAILLKAGLRVESKIGLMTSEEIVDSGIDVHSSLDGKYARIAVCLANGLSATGLSEVTINREMHIGNMSFNPGGGMTLQWAPGAHIPKIMPAGPLKIGSPLIVTVGVKPAQYLR